MEVIAYFCYLGSALGGYFLFATARKEVKVGSLA